VDKLNFTKRALDSLDIPSTGRRTYHDQKVPGLVIRVSPSGNKSYYLYRKILGHPRRIHIGHYPALTPDQARSKAVELIGKVARGEDPRESRQQADTLNDLWNEYAAAKAHLKRLSDQRYWYKRYLRTAIGSKPLKALIGRDIDRVSASILAEGKRSTAVHVMELFKRLIKFGVDGGLCAPLAFKVTVPRYDDRKTEDLSPEQLSRLLAVLAEEKDRQVVDLVHLTLFTGLRKSESLGLTWADIDFERDFILLRDPKSGVATSIPMNQSARAVLKSIDRRDSEFVFPNESGGQRHRSAFSRQLRCIRGKAGIPDDFRPLHGLRHVYASMLASSGKVDMYTLQKLLTHKSPQMTQRYAHLRDDTLRRAAAVVDDLIQMKLD
jgi:integrase